MPTFKPFSALHAEAENIGNFTSHSVDYYSEEELNILLRKPELSFTKIIEPVLKGTESIEVRYQKIRAHLDELIESAELKSTEANYFHYTKINQEGQLFHGLLGLVKTSDYDNGLIKKHEETVHAREIRFANYLQAVHFQAEPVLLTFESNDSTQKLFEKINALEDGIPFIKDNEKHLLTPISKKELIQEIEDCFDKIPSFYIADGHHRMGSTATYSKMDKDNEKSQFCMAYLIPSEQLEVKDFARIVSDLNDYTSEEFISELAKTFDIKESSGTYYPSKKHHISMYLEGKFYKLYVKKKLRGIPEGLGDLDVYVLEKNIFSTLLGIEDSRLDPRVNFMRGTGDSDGMKEMKTIVDQLGGVGFGFYPVDFRTLKRIADFDQRMPPKSTYIQPKLLSGLLIYDMK